MQDAIRLRAALRRRRRYVDEPVNGAEGLDALGDCFLDAGFVREVGVHEDRGAVGSICSIQPFYLFFL